MSGITSLIERLQSVNMDEIVADAMYNTQQRLADSQRNQMLEGLAGDGKKIGKYKSKEYAAMKNQLSPLAGFGNVDLKLEGPFQFEIFAIVDEGGKSVLFGSADTSGTKDADGFSISKVDKLENQYGQRIWGLSPLFAKKYSTNSLAPEAIKLILDKILGS